MAPLRIEVPGGYYHLSTRGNNKCAIYYDDHDRATFLMQLDRLAAKYGWTVLAYCLMSNHYHLIVQIGDLGMSRAMCELNSGYAITYNQRHGRLNHLFGRRYWDALIVEAAASSGCDRLLTEDMTAGETIRGVQIVNPFA